MENGVKNSINWSENHKYQKNMLSKAKFSKKNYFFAAILHSLSVNFSNLRPFLSITFCQGLWISKMFGHLISGTGGKRHKNSTSKSKQTDRRTYHMWIPLLNHYRPWRQISTDQQKIQKTRQICKKKQKKNKTNLPDCLRKVGSGESCGLALYNSDMYMKIQVHGSLIVIAFLKSA